MDKLLSLGIDPWQMLLYLVNTGLVIFILSRYLYKPILNIIDKRKEAIINNIEEAKNLQDEFEKKVTESERRRKESEEKLKEELKKLEKYTEQKRSELIAEMDQVRNDLMERTHKEIEERKANLIQEAEETIKGLMTRIILEIVENKVPEEVIQESIHSAWKK